MINKEQKHCFFVLKLKYPHYERRRNTTVTFVKGFSILVNSLIAFLIIFAELTLRARAKKIANIHIAI